MSPLVKSVIKTGLGFVGLYDASKPASYAEGAPVPTDIPIREIPVPQGSQDPLSAAALDAAAEEALAPRLVATPEGAEPGLFEDLAHLPLTPENVEQILDELVRPALNADGGDISLIKIDNDDIYVKLVGACNTCPSSVMTMRMGVERLLQEEFPTMGELIQVDGGLGSDW